MRVEEPEVSTELRAPFPWFGGKRRVAELVWSRLGNVETYNEPFAGSLAVLLGRPHSPRVETVNDLDCYIANFWRALQYDPGGVAYWADAPVNEADLHAWHRWLVTRGRRLVLRCARDPHYFNVKVAGKWVWGQCLWIGSGWCQSIASFERNKGVRPSLTHDSDVSRRNANTRSERPWNQRKRPAASRNGESVGVHAKRFAGTGNGQGAGVHRQFDRNAIGTVHQRRRPQLTGDHGVIIGTAGQHRRPHLLRDKGVAARRWQGGGQGGGSGVHSPTLTKQQLPAIGGECGGGTGVLRQPFKSIGLYDYLEQLAVRLRRVRVCCGDWKRVLTPSVTTYVGLTGVFLDPPYSHDLRERCYAEDHDISAEVREWALAHGNNPNMRIALCGYEDEHVNHMPKTWEMVPWKAHGGYSRTDRGVENRSKERIWFSPHCLRGEQPSLLESLS